MPARLVTKPCRICAAPIPGQPRRDRKAFYYPRQCAACYDQDRDPAAALAGRLRGLLAARALRTCPEGTTRLDHGGYRLVKTASGWMREHRAVMAAAVGRTLLPSEHVHHRNGDRLDNRLENLELLSHGDHSRHHHTITTWARDHAACIACGDTHRRHLGYGQCSRCYQRARRHTS